MPIIPLAGTSAAKGALVPLGTVRVTNTSTQIINFTSIPAIYQDLYLVCHNTIAPNATGSAGGNFMRLNNDAGSNYSYTVFLGNQTSPITVRASNRDVIVVGDFSFNQPPTETPYLTTVHFLNYANTSTFKTILSRYSSDRNGVGDVGLAVNTWRSTAAINNIYISTFVGVAFYGVGSTWTLYGVRAVNQ